MLIVKTKIYLIIHQFVYSLTIIWLSVCIMNEQNNEILEPMAELSSLIGSELRHLRAEFGQRRLFEHLTRRPPGDASQREDLGMESNLGRTMFPIWLGNKLGLFHA